MDHKNAIFIDFEGEGVSADRQLKIPHMIGEYVRVALGDGTERSFLKKNGNH